MLKQYFVGVAIAAMCITDTAASECSVNISVVQVSQTEEIPQATLDYLDARLKSMVAQSGISTDPGMGQFFLTGRFSHIQHDVLPGPPMQTSVHTDLTLYIGDVNAQTVYASTTLELRGVGTSQQRAFINAMRSLSHDNGKISAFIDQSRQKIIAYYDGEYRTIIAQAERDNSLGDYASALWRLSMIPPCCKGYDTAIGKMLPIYQKYIDKEGAHLLDAAKAAWAVSHDSEGAAEAFNYLSQIDQKSAAYASASKLAEEMKKSVKSDRDFELRQKYNDDISLEKSRIEAASAVGVAYGKGQQPKTTNINWIR